MLQLTGDILNWLAAGVLFPLMLLPAASLLRHGSGQRLMGTLTWLLFVGAVLTAGITFVALVPRLNAAYLSTAQLGADLLRPSIILACITLALAAMIFMAGGPYRAAAHAARLFNAITRGAGRTVMWFLLLMALVQFSVVLMRYVFGVNFIFMQESITYMHALVFLCAAGYALLTDDHVRVDILYRGAPPKRKAQIDLLGTYLFLFPICLLILWTASPYVARSWLVMEGSADTSGIQGVFLLKSLIATFAILLAMAGFVIAHRAVETLAGEKA